MFLDDNCPIRYDDGQNPYLEIEDFQFYYAHSTRQSSLFNYHHLIIYFYFIYKLLDCLTN